MPPTKKTMTVLKTVPEGGGNATCVMENMSPGTASRDFSSFIQSSCGVHRAFSAMRTLMGA